MSYVALASAAARLSSCSIRSRARSTNSVLFGFVPSASLLNTVGGTPLSILRHSHSYSHSHSISSISTNVPTAFRRHHHRACPITVDSPLHHPIITRSLFTSSSPLLFSPSSTTSLPRHLLHFHSHSHYYTTMSQQQHNIPSNKSSFSLLSPLTTTPNAPLPTPVNSTIAARVDEQLLSAHHGFSLDTLMELAGLSVAEAVADATRHDVSCTVAIMCGPGNNGGDGLVCARHLWHFGYKRLRVVFSSSASSARHGGRFDHLWRQLHALGIATYDADVDNDNDEEKDNEKERRRKGSSGKLKNMMDGDDVDVWVDSVFGFSFNPQRGPIRTPYDDMIRTMNTAAATACIVAVDVPSGWHVDLGLDYHQQRNESTDSHDDDNLLRLVMPDVLVSLTVPKQFITCSAVAERRRVNQQWVHYVGGRFVPPAVASSLQLDVPKYKGVRQVVRVE